MRRGRLARPLRSGAAITVALLALPAGAAAHARVSPAVSLAGQLQLYTLAVPTEKAGVSSIKIVLTVPGSFSIDSFVPSPGWRRTLGRSGGAEQVSWTGGSVPAGEDSAFSFLGEAAKPGTVRFTVQQSYSDGSIVDWNGTEAAAAPAPTIEAVSSFSAGGGGAGFSALTVIALVVAVLALLAAGLALSERGGGGRPLA